MPRVGSAAPSFSCSAVVAGQLIRLDWSRLHDNKTLLLLFDSLDERFETLENSLALCAAVLRLSHARVGAAIVCRGDRDTLLARFNQSLENGSERPAIPLIVDPDGLLAALYELPGEGRAPVWGLFLIDASGILRQTTLSGFPFCPRVEDLLRSIRASDFPAETEQWN